MGVKKFSAKTNANGSASAAVAQTTNVVKIAPATATTVAGGGTLGAGGSSVSITAVYVTDSSYNVLDDTALSTSGGYIKVIGSGFATGCILYAGGTAALSTTYISSTELRAQLGPAASNRLHVYVVNPDSSGAIYLTGILYSGMPVWVTEASLDQQSVDSYFSVNVSATAESTINSTVTYAVTAGSSLPPGVSLSSSGVLSGTISGLTVDTVYSFSITATDADLQDTPRTFSVTVVAGEPYFKYTALYLTGAGTNNATNKTFIDESSNNLTITRTGNATQGSFTPFSQTGWSTYFNGSSYLSFPGSAGVSFGTGDFTIEAWFYSNQTDQTKMKAITGNYVNSATGNWQLLFNSIGLTGDKKVGLYIGDPQGWLIVSFGALSFNTWNHVAITRSGTTIRLFLNGILDNTVTSSATIGSDSATCQIGAVPDTVSNFSTVRIWEGYISNIRYTKGAALYTSTFLTSVTPFTTTVSSGTVTLLACRNNRFVDVSSSANAITVNGTPLIKSMSPFSGGTYSPATIGGAGYFDGLVDYVLSSSSTALGMGTGAFTFECWVYPTANPGNGPGTIADVRSGANAEGWVVRAFNDRTIGIYDGPSGTYKYSTGTITLNAWNHIAIVRSSTSAGGTAFYINGAAAGTTTIASDLGSSFSAMIGFNRAGSGYEWNGYISGMRIIKGSALYSAPFAIPTAPPTAVAGTSLLLNFTNAGVVDAAAKNVIETVNDVKISTTQSKWGTGSIYFDGTGDYLSMPSNELFAFGTNDFTIEMWVYASDINYGNRTLVVSSAFDTGGPFLLHQYGDYIRFWSPGLASSYLEYGLFTATTWTHIAVTRNNRTLRLFINGTQRASGTDNSNYSDKAIRIGARFDGTENFNGYINDLRITTGLARYTANFTAPTATFRRS